MPKPSDLRDARETYASLQTTPRALDMTRGKPAPEQLDLSNQLLRLPGDAEYIADGVDTRNYGGLDGLPAAKRLFADILETSADAVLVGGNSSLTLMYDTLQRACQFGVPGGDAPWNAEPSRKFICVVPGYDRHFAITERLGFELLSVDMSPDGPDMDAVERLVAGDATIKGIWCVPKYSNPDGTCYSEDCVKRLAQMRAAAPDFRIMWDNAYAEHHLDHDPPRLANIAKFAAAAGNPDRVVQFASTSKICHPGSGVAAMASSVANIADAKTHIAFQSIGPDKVNQLRLLRFLGDLDALRSHMRRHAALVKPKFELVQAILQTQLGGLPGVSWSNPRGGYFICLIVPDRCAARVVDLAAAAGVKLTAAGAPFPYGKDPRNRVVRIAPTFPSLDEIREATEVLSACVKLAYAESAG